MKRWAVFLIFFLFFSCDKMARDQGAKKPEGRSDRAALTENGGRPLLNEKNEEAARFLEKYPVRKGFENGKEIIAIGNVKFTGIGFNSSLVKKDPESYIIEIRQYNDEYKGYLAKNGIVIGYYVPDNELIVRCPKDIQELRRLNGIKSVIPYQPFMKIAEADGDTAGIKKAKVMLWEKADRAWFEEYSRKNGVRIMAKAGNDYMVETEDIKPLLFEDRVLRVEKYREPAVFSFSANEIEKVLTINNPAYLRDAPVAVSVFDVGVDSSQNNLSGALRNVFDTALDGDKGEFVSHGTHISGIIAGRGNNSMGGVSGVNPEAKIDFYAMGDSLKGLIIPPSMADLFNTSINNNAYIANLSWGTYDDGNEGRYLSISRDIDEFIYEHPGFIIIAAAGNNGVSIASPATAKNVISVGALDGNALASYSPTNFCYDGRVKPDITVQGSAVNSLNLNNGYIVLNGTSQAAALVSGFVSKIYYGMKMDFGISPTHSAVKSVLAASSGDAETKNGYGYGKLFFNTPFSKKYYDIENLEGPSGVMEFSRWLTNGDEIRAVLSWTDPPAYEFALYALIDNYELEIETPDGEKIRTGDPLDNIKKITYHTTKAGVYFFRIIPAGVPLPVRDMTLVVRSLAGVIENPPQETNQNPNPVSGGPQSSGNLLADQVLHDAPSDIQSEVQTMLQENGSSSSPAMNPQSGNNGQTGGVPADPGTALGGLSSASNAAAEYQLYRKYGINAYSLRGLGFDDVDFIGATFSISNLPDQYFTVPVKSFTNANDTNEGYKKVQLNIPDSSAILNSSLLVKNDNTQETNAVSVKFILDSTAPSFGDRDPLNNGILTSPSAWIEIIDTQSGVDTNFTVSVNGAALSNGQYDYNYGNNKLTLYLDRVLVLTNVNIVDVRLINVCDMVGNAAPAEEWKFITYITNNTTPPAKPEGLTAHVSNRTVFLDWHANRETDLKGYKVYLVKGDYSSSEPLTAAPIAQNHYEINRQNVEIAGVTALDQAGNESETAYVDVSYIDMNYPPDIFIKNVPERTNGNVIADIQIRDDGYIAMTNVILDAQNLYGTWSNQDGYFTIDGNGPHTLTVIARDDDGNTVTNAVSFEIDKNAPNPPDFVTWQAQRKNVLLTWGEVNKNGNNCSYRVYLNNQNLEENWPLSNYTISPADYGRFSIGVSAVDSLGNESAVKYVIADTETGIAVNIGGTLVSGNIHVEADALLASTRYDSLGVRLSSGNSVKNWDFAGTNYINEDLSLAGIPDGDYTLTVFVSSNGAPVNTAAFNTNITVDQTPPVIVLADGNITNTAPFMITRSDHVEMIVSDAHYQSCLVNTGNSAPLYYYTNHIGLSIAGEAYISVRASDAAGNTLEKSFRIVSDTEPPLIDIAYADGFIFGRINDAYLKGYSLYSGMGPDSMTNLFYSSDFPADGIISSVPFGSSTVEAVAFDMAGNTNTAFVDIPQSNTTNAPDSIDEILVNNGSGVYFNARSIDISFRGSLGGFVRFDVFQNNNPLVSSGDILQQSYTVSGLNDGEYTLRVSGSGLWKEKNIVIDTLGPVIVIGTNAFAGQKISSAVSINEPNPANTEYWIMKEGSGLDLRLADPDELFEQGLYTIQVNCSDLAGNTAENTGLVEVIDARTNWLAAHFTGITDGGFYNSPVRLGILEKDTAVQYRVNGLPGGDYLDKEGVYYIDVSARSLVSNMIYTNSAGITLDFTPPLIVCSITDGGYYPALPPVFIDDRYLLDKDIRIDGMSYSNGDIGDGLHSIMVRAWDRAGNSNSFAASFNIDTEPPSVSVQPADGSYTQINLTVSADDGGGIAGMEYSVNGKSFPANGSFDSEGDYFLTVTASDRAGNQTSVSRYYSIDRTPPVIALNIEDGGYYGTNLVVAGMNQDLHPSTLDIYIDGLKYTGFGINTEGPHTLRAAASDRAGNSSVKEARFIIDGTPPLISVSGVENNGAYKMPVSYSVSVSDPNIDSSEILLDGETAPMTGSAGTEGDHLLRITARDKAGNTSIKEINFYCGETLPLLAISGVQNGMSYGGAVEYRVEKTTSDVFDIHVVLNGADAAENGSCADEGTYTLTASAHDASLNYFERTIRFNIDKTPPRFVITGISDGGFYNHPAVYSFGALDANGADIAAYHNGAPIPANGTLDGEGGHSVRLTASDMAGNRSETNISFVIDRTGPRISIIGAEDGVIYRTSRYIEIGIDEANLDHYSVKINGDETNATNLLISADGTFSLDVTAYDKAGNTAEEQAKFMVDLTPPQISLEDFSPCMNNLNAGIHIADSEVFNQFYIYLNGSTVMRASNIAAAETNIYLRDLMINGSPAVSGDGNYTLEAIAIDRAGNPADTRVQGFIYDTTPPALYSLYPPDGAVLTRADVRAVVMDQNLQSASVYLNGSLAASVNSDTNMITLLPGAVTAEGVYHMQVSAIDKAGNQSATNTVFIIDNTPPIITVNGITPGGWYNGGRPITITNLDANLGAYYITDDCHYTNGWTPYAHSGSNADGVYSFNSANEGAHTLTVTASNKAGLITTTNIVYYIDEHSPELWIRGGVDITNGGFYRNDPGLTAEIFDNMNSYAIPNAIESINLWVSYSNAAGWADYENWTNLGTYTLALSVNKTYNIGARAVDKAGNALITNIIITLDSIPPDIAVTGVTDSGKYNSNRFINVTLSDDYLDPTRCLVRLDGADQGPLALAGRDLTMNVPDSRESSNKELFVEAFDRAGNSNIRDIHYMLDMTRPSDVVFAGITNGALTNGGWLGMTSADACSGVEWLFYTINGIEFSNNNSACSNHFGTNDSPAAVFDNNGTNNISAYAVDYCSNHSATNYMSFMLDTISPQVAIEGWDSISNYYSTNNITQNIDTNTSFRFRVIVNDNYLLNTVTVFENSNPLGTLSITGSSFTNVYTGHTFDGNCGPFDITVNASDRAGNLTTNKTFKYSFQDDTPPQIIVMNSNQLVQDSGFYASRTNFTGLVQIYDSGGIDYSTLRLSGSRYQSGDSATNAFSSFSLVSNSWSNCTVIVPCGGNNMQETVYQLSVEVSNKSKCFTSNDIMFLVDEKPPEVTVSGFSHYGGVTNSMICYMGGSCSIYDIAQNSSFCYNGPQSCPVTIEVFDSLSCHGSFNFSAINSNNTVSFNIAPTYSVVEGGMFNFGTLNYAYSLRIIDAVGNTNYLSDSDTSYWIISNTTCGNSSGSGGGSGL